MKQSVRRAVQGVALLVQNANFKGFFTGRIYTGAAKKVCVPGLNCYSCPAAVGSCPVGSLQNALSAMKFRFPFYVAGLLLFFGALLGRAVCGLLCPFGLFQDLLHKIPSPVKVSTFKGDRLLRKLKYIVLIMLVVVLPACIKLTPFFCKYLCPSGTMAGILLALSDTALFRVIGHRFVWKACVLAAVAAAGIFVLRPFCKYLCPLGAFYAPFNRFSLLQIQIEREKCTGCGTCSRVCQMTVNPSASPNHSECIRCGNCISSCPEAALHFEMIFQEAKRKGRMVHS